MDSTAPPKLMEISADHGGPTVDRSENKQKSGRSKERSRSREKREKSRSSSHKSRKNKSPARKDKSPARKSPARKDKSPARKSPARKDKSPARKSAQKSPKSKSPARKSPKGKSPSVSRKSRSYSRGREAKPLKSILSPKEPVQFARVSSFSYSDACQIFHVHDSKDSDRMLECFADGMRETFMAVYADLCGTKDIPCPCQDAGSGDRQQAHRTEAKIRLAAVQCSSDTPWGRFDPVDAQFSRFLQPIRAAKFDPDFAVRTIVIETSATESGETPLAKWFEARIKKSIDGDTVADSESESDKDDPTFEDDPEEEEDKEEYHSFDEKEPDKSDASEEEEDEGDDDDDDVEEDKKKKKSSRSPSRSTSRAKIDTSTSDSLRKRKN
jgi:hypothetical protein